MPNIQVLDPHVADLIAAGEVVERPASVVKELLENAIDAGAKAVTVEIMNGGMSYIRVTDDGCGIPADDAPTAFLRHATSKIRTEYDLEAIGTLGFRGEALAAIAAVSRVELVTRTEAAALGRAVTLEGGQVLANEEAGGPQGTTIVVRDLFFNTPARLKYMKKDSAEGAAVFAAVQNEALAHPEVSLKFIRDGKQDLLTPGDGQLKSAVYSVLGRDLALGFLGVRGTGDDGIVVSGFASLPACCRASRSYQYFFVNGRFVKSRLMMAALEEAYKNQHMVGKFPGCVLHVETRLGSVDVNVHPAKTEVKFLSDKRIFDAVYHAVLGSLEAKNTPPAAEWKPQAPKVEKHDTVTPNQTAFQAMPAAELKRKLMVDEPPSLPLNDVMKPISPAAPYQPPGDSYARPVFSAPSPRVAEPAAGTAGSPAVRAEERPVPEKPAEAENLPAVKPAAPEPEPVPPVSEPWNVRGELFNTYIFVEQGEKAFLIDKHAAHERMNFDRLKSSGYSPMIQQLLIPAVFTPSAEEGAALLQNLDLLTDFGFEAEDFGGGAILVRRSPDYVDAADVEGVLTELAAQLLTVNHADPSGARDALMATMACKAAIKGGQRSGHAELETVAKAVMNGEVRYCPHGRPVSIELTKGQLEKMFKRA